MSIVNSFKSCQNAASNIQYQKNVFLFCKFDCKFIVINVSQNIFLVLFVQSYVVTPKFIRHNKLFFRPRMYHTLMYEVTKPNSLYILVFLFPSFNHVRPYSFTKIVRRS